MAAAPDADGGWGAAVLCGGASRRMGRDKALLVVDGQPMALRVVTAAAAAGAATIVAVGGDGPRLRALFEPGVSAGHAQGSTNVGWMADDQPGEGPLGAIVTALDHLTEPVVLVVSCDLVDPDPRAMAATVAALGAEPGAAVAAPRAGGAVQWMHAAWRRAAARDPLAAAFAAGERSVRRAVGGAGLRVVHPAGIAPAALSDADTPADLDNCRRSVT
jgi:molybdopterin-guanine dinucleotide biosynthesis protein A